MLRFPQGCSSPQSPPALSPLRDAPKSAQGSAPPTTSRGCPAPPFFPIGAFFAPSPALPNLLCLQRLLLPKSRPLSDLQQLGPSWSLLPAPTAGLPHLATATAEPVAAHGVMSQGAFLATVPARAAALLRDAGRRGGRRASPHPPHPDPPSRPHPRLLSLTWHWSLTCTEPQSHSSPASTKPFPHSGGSRSWTGKGCRESDPDPTPSPAPKFHALGLVP